MQDVRSLVQEEVERFEVERQLLKIATGGLYRAPISVPRKVLNVACNASGFWCLDVAEKFWKTAEVVGVDSDDALLVEALRKKGIHPANFHFVQLDLLNNPLPFEDHSFDFTYARFLSLSVPVLCWGNLLTEMVRVTKPGGYVEVVDQEAGQTKSGAFLTLREAVQHWMRQQNLHPAPGPYLADWLCEAHLVRVEGRRILVGSGPQESRQQRLLLANFGAMFSHLQPLVIQAGIISAEGYASALERLKADLQTGGLIWPITHAYGMRPL